MQGERNESSDIGASLFSGMTVTSSPETTASDELSLMGHADVTPVTKQQSDLAETATENTQDFAPAVLGNILKCACYI